MTSTRPHFQAALRKGVIDWEYVSRAFATEKRYRALAPGLRKLLTEKAIPFLPEASSPAFLERNTTTTARTPGDPLSVYWADLRRLRPTTRQEEYLLARCIDLLRGVLEDLALSRPHTPVVALLQEYLSPYSPVLKTLEERGAKDGKRTLGRKILGLLQQRVGELRGVQNALVDRNLHLVPAVSNRYRHLGVAWEDLIQEGNTALLRAVERYDRKEGARFSSYASWWIHQGILHALSFQSRTVRLPVYLAQALHRVRDYVSNAPDVPPIDEIALRTRLSPDRVERAMTADRSCLSIDRTPSSDEDDDSYRCFLADRRETPLPDEPKPEELRETLLTLLHRLPEREALVLRLRFGLDDGRPRTLEEVRAVLGVSRERVRQLQAQSLRRLSQPTPRRILSRYA